MKNVLYIGNVLSNKGKTVTSIEVLGNFLSGLYHVKTASNKSNKILRLLDMTMLVLNNKNKTDYVLIDTYSTANFYYALIIAQICKWFNIKYIPILRGGDLESRLIKNPKMSQAIFKYAYKLIAPSSFLKTIFNKYGYSDITFIPNTIEINRYKFKNREIDTIKLLWVRSFAELYNPKMAVLVLKQLIEKGYKTQLTMVGPDNDGTLSKVKHLAEENNVKVNFTGKLSKKDWLALSEKSNIFINTTNFDNTPVSVIEAMALGLPVVSTNVGGLPNLIIDKKEGILVPPTNVEEMVDQIINLKKDKKLKDSMVINARKKVEQFDWEVVKPKWEALLS
ncbi:glycosyltransferase family 4 protein [uncultured Winogradskyella sp.]|uniref:glycosyltransferase family 4 protein n=1 Tax=uncultured Winogradskyella sp. TaxID=395353 RepID=UPI002633AC1B|nr:glycosyltransferase family 4 protein [uncultured Winogradskyella sp.]